jgi:hypothetical protein
MSVAILTSTYSNCILLYRDQFALFCAILRTGKVGPWIVKWLQPQLTPFCLLQHSSSNSDLYYIAHIMCYWWRLPCNDHYQYSYQQTVRITGIVWSGTAGDECGTRRNWGTCFSSLSIADNMVQIPLHRISR